MRPVTRILLALPLAALLAAPAVAQGTGMMGGGNRDQMDQGMMGQGMMGQGSMGQGSMGWGMMGQGMMGGRMQGPMMGMGGMMGDPGARIEGRLAFLHAELGITPDQEQAWSAFADAARASAASMSEMHKRMTELDSPPTLPERMALMQEVMASRLDSMRKMHDAIDPLYEELSPEQKKTADSIMGMM